VTVRAAARKIFLRMWERSEVVKDHRWVLIADGASMSGVGRSLVHWRDTPDNPIPKPPLSVNHLVIQNTVVSGKVDQESGRGHRADSDVKACHTLKEVQQHRPGSTVRQVSAA
jgi:hypothetical protein